MYIGRFGINNNSFFTNNYSSYVVTPAGNTGCHNHTTGKKWVGLQGAGGTSTGSGYGKDCAAARKDFCNKYGYRKPDGSRCCYGDSGCRAHDTVPAAITTRTRTPTGSVERVSPNPAHPNYKQMVQQASEDNSRTTSRGGGGTSASKVCGGCDAGNIGCELGKLSCEFGNFANNWWDGMGESIGKGTGGWLPIAIVGLGGLLAIVLITKRR